MNHHQGMTQSPGETSLRVTWQGLAAAASAALVALGLYSQSLVERSVATPAAPRAGWVHSAIVDADSPRAQAYSDHKKLAVRLPDSSAASVVVAAGEPQALLLPSSNSLASHRERALQAGASEGQDSSVVLPAITKHGELIDFVIRADGSTVASAPRYDAAATLSAGISDKRSLTAGR